MTDEQPRHALGRLIQEVMDAESIGTAELARRSGGKLKRGQFNEWRDLPRKEALQPDNVLALARALGRPPRQVWAAIGVTLGILQEEGEDRPELSIRTEDPLFGVLTHGDVNEVVAHAIKIAELRRGA